MTHAGDPGSDLNPVTVERLRAHGAAIAAAGSVPSRMRADVTEELFGHLAERTQAAIGRGSTETDAAEAAIAAFGGVDQLAADLSGAFHSRLWMSTIGVLLPAMAARDGRPGVIGWLRFVLAVGMVMTGVGMALVLWEGTLGRALAAVVLGGLGLGALVLAFQALARGQRWAVWYAIAFAAELVVFGVISIVAPEVPGSLTIPLGAMLGIGVLLGVHAASDRVRTFMAGSRPVGGRLQAVLLVSLLGPPLVNPAASVIADPTQATADDLRMVVNVQCDRGDVVEPGYPTRHDIQQVTIVADMTWSRSDLLPNGLNGLLNPSQFGDTAGFRLEAGAMDGPLPWLLAARDPAVVDLASGEVAGGFGATSPSVALIPETIGSFTVDIDLGAIREGRTLRATWLLTPTSDTEMSWPTVEVAYAHLDRFLLTASARCGETSLGQSVPLPPPASVPDDLGIGIP